MRIKKEKVKKIFKIILRVVIFVILLFCLGQVVHATGLKDSKIVTGTEKLVGELIDWLTGIGITICGGYFIYYVYCLKSNDEGERRRNIQNIKTTLISIVLITCGIALIDVILGFYK